MSSDETMNANGMRNRVDYHNFHRRLDSRESMVRAHGRRLYIRIDYWHRDRYSTIIYFEAMHTSSEVSSLPLLAEVRSTKALRVKRQSDLPAVEHSLFSVNSQFPSADTAAEQSAYVSFISYYSNNLSLNITWPTFSNILILKIIK